MAENDGGVGRQQRSKSLPATYFKTVNSGGLWQMPSEPMLETVDLSSIDSPVQKKRWWRRLSSARNTDFTDRGRSVSLPNNVPRRESSHESDGPGQEPAGWRARFVNSLRRTVRHFRQMLTNGNGGNDVSNT
ncbi:hypothetical protein CDAR_208171 [Caerostris darwini]|uniref:Uncharacterized protein n=1 Tax=Caerostris darwini TaxID=1538125 RepID=A0AAV4RH28_9ARAC|nr:hypothetical protein CDAR_208171 [Caerostris darwini]